MTSNQLRYWELQEARRSNKAKERETRRANRMSENLTRAYQQGTLELRAQELAETSRSHQVNEAISLAGVQENVRHNMVYEKETQRHNVQSEQLTSRQLDISAATLNENIRSHKANERIAQGNLAEMRRHNVTQEGISKLQVDAETKYKQAMVEQGGQRLVLDAQHIENEKQRVLNDTYSRREAYRHDKETEAIQKEQNRLREYQVIVEGVGQGFRAASAFAMAMA